MAKLESQISEKIVKDKKHYYLTCRIRNKEIKLTPEEVVRQLYLMILMDDYGYPVERIQLEYGVTFGRDDSKRADIVVFDKDNPNAAYIIVELKKPETFAKFPKIP